MLYIYMYMYIYIIMSDTILTMPYCTVIVLYFIIQYNTIQYNTNYLFIPFHSLFLLYYIINGLLYYRLLY